jgi:hypothetical protein
MANPNINNLNAQNFSDKFIDYRNRNNQTNVDLIPQPNNPYGHPVPPIPNGNQVRRLKKKREKFLSHITRQKNQQDYILSHPNDSNPYVLQSNKVVKLYKEGAPGFIKERIVVRRRDHPQGETPEDAPYGEPFILSSSSINQGKNLTTYQHIRNARYPNAPPDQVQIMETIYIDTFFDNVPTDHDIQTDPFYRGYYRHRGKSNDTVASRRLINQQNGPPKMDNFPPSRNDTHIDPLTGENMDAREDRKDAAFDFYYGLTPEDNVRFPHKFYNRRVYEALQNKIQLYNNKIAELEQRTNERNQAQGEAQALNVQINELTDQRNAAQQQLQDLQNAQAAQEQAAAQAAEQAAKAAARHQRQANARRK